MVLVGHGVRSCNSWRHFSLARPCIFAPSGLYYHQGQAVRSACGVSSPFGATAQSSAGRSIFMESNCDGADLPEQNSKEQHQQPFHSLTPFLSGSADRRLPLAWPNNSTTLFCLSTPFFRREFARRRVLFLLFEMVFCGIYRSCPRPIVMKI